MLDFPKSLIHSALNKVLQRLHYPLEVMLTCVRWYVAYPLSLRHIEEMMHERGVFVDHSLLIISVFVVVFLEIHPFQDGNGLLSRVLTTLLLIQAGYTREPYNSLESVI